MKTRTGVWLLTALLCSSLMACDWVDSTGTQGTTARTEIFLDDTPLGSVAVLNEKAEVEILASRSTTATDNQTYTWSDSPSQAGALAACAAEPGFSSGIAADTLAQACTDSDDCSVGFERIDTSDGVAAFVFAAPELKASVGLRYALTVSNETGVIDTRDLDLCLIAINESPDANDDTFVVREGIRETFTLSGIHLLSNDSDDIDDSNSDLVVLNPALVAPTNAAFFELGTDGSFVYESNLEGILADQFDSFEYELSDGTYVSTARVSLRVVASNQAPEQIDEIPALRAEVGELFTENLSLYFTDPEQGTLSYSFAAGFDLPEDSGMSLRSNGVLSGTPLLTEVGSYTLKLVASDGGQELETLLALTISNSRTGVLNEAPEFIEDTVFDQIVFLGSPISIIVPEFEDGDDDELSYSIFGTGQLPAGVTIESETGVISGSPLARTWVRDLRIEATDPSGASAVSDLFYIRVL